jgi:hypothetical protein
VPGNDPVADLAVRVAAGTLVVQAERTTPHRGISGASSGMAAWRGMPPYGRALMFAMFRLLNVRGS